MDVVSQLWGVGAIAVLALLISCWQVLKIRRLKAELAGIRQQLADSKTEGESTKVNFSDSLTQVERQFVPPGENTGSRSERYRYVASLAAQGIDAKGIAAALQMAPAEVKQLMQLARLKNQVQNSEH